MDVRLSNQHRDPEAFKRFGWAIVASSLVIASVAALVFMRNPTDTLQPSVVSTGGLFAGGRYAPTAVIPEVGRLLDTFVGALEHDDQARMHATFPGMTPHDARVLRALRKRLGETAHLTVADAQLQRSSQVGALDANVQFVILSRKPEDREELRLPFTAHVRNANGHWLIVELR